MTRSSLARLWWSGLLCFTWSDDVVMPEVGGTLCNGCAECRGKEKFLNKIFLPFRCKFSILLPISHCNVR